MAVFFTADTHFGDRRTINIHRRPFASVGEMDAAAAGHEQVPERADNCATNPVRLTRAR